MRSVGRTTGSSGVTLTGLLLPVPSDSASSSDMSRYAGSPTMGPDDPDLQVQESGPREPCADRNDDARRAGRHEG
jgi:hypothetical protein